MTNYAKDIDIVLHESHISAYTYRIHLHQAEGYAPSDTTLFYDKSWRALDGRFLLAILR